MIALDDFVENDKREPLTDFADILKVDVRNTTPEQRIAMVKRYSPRRRMLAEKVETREEFLTAKKAGFVYFRDTSFVARKP
jgi:c-di-GMP phosphodiesterase